MECRKRKYLGLLIRENQGIKRDIILAAQSLLADRGDWEICLMGNVLDQKTAYLWTAPDAMMVWADGPEDLAVAASFDIPKVFLGNVKEKDHPHVWYDNHKIGTDIADLFLSRGYRSFAIYADRIDAFPSYSRERVAGFRETIGETGAQCPVFSVRRVDFAPGDANLADPAIEDWLRGLEKPVGIMADCDPAGVGLLAACMHFGLRVPEDVSVIAVGGDELLCGFTVPEMSAMKFDGQAVALEAVKLLEDLLSGRGVGETVLPAAGFNERHSTSIFVNGDEVVEKALRLIRDETLGGLTVDATAAGCGVSRRVLEKRFAKVMGRGVFAEIRRTRIEAACEMLHRSDKSVAEIGERCGFGDASRFSEAFRKAKGCTPRRFRATSRG